MSHPQLWSHRVLSLFSSKYRQLAWRRLSGWEHLVGSGSITVCVRGGTGMAQLGAEAENKHNAAFHGSAMRCHAWVARLGCAATAGRAAGGEPCSDLLYTDRPSVPGRRRPQRLLLPSGDQREDHVLHRGGGTHRCWALACTVTVTADRAILSSHIWDHDLWPDATFWQGNSSRARETLRTDAERRSGP